jgi:hypothetical protein
MKAGPGPPYFLTYRLTPKAQTIFAQRGQGSRVDYGAGENRPRIRATKPWAMATLVLIVEVYTQRRLLVS